MKTSEEEGTCSEERFQQEGGVKERNGGGGEITKTHCINVGNCQEKNRKK